MENYKSKIITAEAAVAAAVKDGDWVDYGFGGGFPELLDKALAARKGHLRDVKIRGGLVIRPRIEVVEADPEQESFSYYSWHIGDYERKLQTRGLVKFMPVVLRLLPTLYRQRYIRTDVAFVPVSAPDENGYCGLGISNFAWRTMFESARTVIFEINEHYPKLQGVDGSHRVHLSEADYIVEGAHEPLPVRTYKAPSETDIQIAKLVVNEIPDGAVLSLGVGGVPFTVANMLAESDLRDLGCHTGTISDAYLNLWKAGKLTNAKKEFDTGLSTWNLAMGSQEFYDWISENPKLFHPADLDYVHDPQRIGTMKNVISINGGVQLDLMGQENAESAGTRQLSGIGGQMDIAAKLSRKAISTRRWDDVNPDPELAALEAELKDAINGLGLGAGGRPGICGGGGDRRAGHCPPCAGQVFRPRRGQCGRGGAVCGPPPLRARGGRQRAGPEGGRPHRRTGGGVHRHRRQRSVRRGRVGPGAGHGHHRPGSGQGGVRRPAGGKAGGLCQ